MVLRFIFVQVHEKMCIRDRASAAGMRTVFVSPTAMSFTVSSKPDGLAHPTKKDSTRPS